MWPNLYTRLAFPAVAAAALVWALGAATPLAAQSAPAEAVVPAIAATATLAPEEEASLLFMFEEEKLAHDLYVALGNVAAVNGWALPVFDNIARAETMHANAVQRLLIRYDVNVTAVDLPTGEFHNADLQALYDALLVQASASAADALAAGALVEETDIADLDARVATSAHADISRVYAQLRKGSTHHLQAFTGLLENRGGARYTPQVLSSEEYAAALAAPRPGRAGRRGH